MTEPRTRTAAEVADDYDAWWRRIQAHYSPTALVERLGDLVEDLAAAVARQDPPAPPPFPPVAWPITFKCEVDPTKDHIMIKTLVQGDFLFSSLHCGGSQFVSVVVSASNARLLAHAILDRLDGAP